MTSRFTCEQDIWSQSKSVEELEAISQDVFLFQATILLRFWIMADRCMGSLFSGQLDGIIWASGDSWKENWVINLRLICYLVRLFGKKIYKYWIFVVLKFWHLFYKTIKILMVIFLNRTNMTIIRVILNNSHQNFNDDFFFVCFTIETNRQNTMKVLCIFINY